MIQIDDKTRDDIQAQITLRLSGKGQAIEDYLGDLTGQLSTKAAELDQRVPELKTLITEARALANSEETDKC